MATFQCEGVVAISGRQVTYEAFQRNSAAMAIFGIQRLENNGLYLTGAFSRLTVFPAVVQVSV
jgi:hypothetical protein